jgi:hypothetical protein
VTSETTSTLSIAWALREGGSGKTERRYRDLLVDGAPFLAPWRYDKVTHFGWSAAVDPEIEAIDRLALRAPPDLPGGRTSLYVCAECGDLGCGALSMVVEMRGETVEWRDFANQNDYDGEIHREGHEGNGPVRFEIGAYLGILDDLRREAHGRRR